VSEGVAEMTRKQFAQKTIELEKKLTRAQNRVARLIEQNADGDKIDRAHDRVYDIRVEVRDHELYGMDKPLTAAERNSLRLIQLNID
jgi:hypothetical protein